MSLLPISSIMSIISVFPMELPLCSLKTKSSEKSQMPQPSCNPVPGPAFVHVGIVDVVVVICKGIPQTINTEVDGITLSKL